MGSNINIIVLYYPVSVYEPVCVCVCVVTQQRTLEQQHKAI